MMYLVYGISLCCSHEGEVQVSRPLNSLTLNGNPILCVDDLIGAEIRGCKQQGPGLKPCGTVRSVLTGRSEGIMVDGKVPLLQSVIGLTDGMPPGTVIAKKVNCDAQTLVKSKRPIHKQGVRDARTKPRHDSSTKKTVVFRIIDDKTGDAMSGMKVLIQYPGGSTNEHVTDTRGQVVLAGTGLYRLLAFVGSNVPKLYKAAYSKD